MPGRPKSFIEPSPLESTTSIEVRAGDGGDSLITYHAGVAGNIRFRDDRIWHNDGSTTITERIWGKSNAEGQEAEKEQEKTSGSGK